MKRTLPSVTSAIVIALMTQFHQALADTDRLHLQASFAVAFSAPPNSPPVTYCGGPPLGFNVEVHGNGYSSVGALALLLQKTIDQPGRMHGCLTLSTPDGDSLLATYDGTVGDANANNFITDSSGTLTFTGGTGLFAGASGKAVFTAVFNSLINGTGTPPFQGIAFYLIDGKVSVGGSDQ